MISAADLIHSARTKLHLLADGLKISPAAAQVLDRRAKRRLRVRSGSCGGLDLILPGGIYVNAPVDEHFAATSEFSLRADGENLSVFHPHDGLRLSVDAVPEPAYYTGRARSGRVLQQIGQLCSDRLGIGLTNACVYWASEQTRCKFCSIGLNVRTGHEIGRKPLDDVLDTVAAAVEDPVVSARHVLLGGGTPAGDDAGGRSIAEAAREIKRRHPALEVYAMIAPPDDLGVIDLLVESGVDELGVNVEVFGDTAAKAYVPGKHRVGMGRFLTVLERAVECYAAAELPERPGRVRSITVVGLEEESETVRGVRLLASLGVMPILTPFRPMVGTEMENHPRWPGERLWDLAAVATEAAGEWKMPLGPTCIPCQSNTLNVPGHPAYRYY
jgi:Radical SAM superfamily